MTHRKHSMARAAAALMFLLSGAPTIARAQSPAPTAGMKSHDRHGMKDMQGMPEMSDMMHGPHHVLAMAYRDNLVTFARALRAQVTPSKAVDLDLARPAVAEMRRSFDQMHLHHKAQMAMMGHQAMGDQQMADKKAADDTMGGMKMGGMQMGGMKTAGPTKPSMATAMAAMDAQLTALDEQLTALESDVSASAPDPTSVSGHLAEILKHCAAMASPPATAQPHRMK